MAVIELSDDQIEKLKADGVEIKEVDLDGQFAQIRKKSDSKASKAIAEAQAKAEADIETLREELEEAKTATGNNTEAEKVQKQLEKMQTKLAEIEQAKADAESKLSSMSRKQALAEIRRNSGVKFADGFNQAIAERAFEEKFADLDNDDLSDPESYKSLIEAFRSENPAMVRADSNGGTGVKTGEKSKAGKLTMEAWKALPFTEQQARRKEVLES